MPKTKCDGAEDPTIKNFYKIDNITFLICPLKVRIDWSQPQYFLSTEVERNTPWRQVFSGTHIHQQRHIPTGKNK